MCSEREVINSYKWSALRYSPVLSGTCPARNVDESSGFELRSSAVATSRIFWSHLPTAGNSGSSSPSTVVLCVLCCPLYVCRSELVSLSVHTCQSSLHSILHCSFKILFKKSSVFFSKTLHCEIGISLCFIYQVVFFKCVYLTTPSVAKIIQRWWQMIEYGALVGWYCQGKMVVRGEKPFSVLNPTWNDLGSNTNPSVRPAPFPRSVATFPCSQLDRGILNFNKHLLQGASFLRNEDVRLWAADCAEGVLQTVLTDRVSV